LYTGTVFPEAVPIVFDNEIIEALVEGMPEKNIFDKRLFARIGLGVLLKIDCCSVAAGVFLPKVEYKIPEYSKISFMEGTEKYLKNAG